jgi:hypothetical protein
LEVALYGSQRWALGGESAPTLRLWLAAPEGGAFTLGRPGGKSAPTLRLWLAAPKECFLPGVPSIERPNSKKAALERLFQHQKFRAYD